MRVNRCLAPALSVLLLLASTGGGSAQRAMAQVPEFASPGGYPPGAAPPWVQPAGGFDLRPAPVYQSSFEDDFGASPGPVDGYSPMSAPPGAQPPMYPYPAISPYDHQFSETRNDADGLWRWEGLRGDRKYFFTLEGFEAKLRRPGSQKIGATLDPDDIPLLAAASFVDTNANFFGRVYMQDTGSLIFQHAFETGGIRGRWGFDNIDRSGFVVEGFWASDVSRKGDPGDIILGYVPPYPPPNGNITDPTTLRPFMAVPANDGSATGTLIRYDSDFSVSYSAEAFGASLNYVKTPVLGRDVARIRPVFGIRYINLHEQYGFQGSDSTLEYATTATFVDKYLVDYQIDVTTIEPNFFGNPPYSSYIDSNVWTNLAGPEIGLEYSVGGAKLRVMGHSKFALMANAEKIKLAGDDFGNGKFLDLDTGDNFFSQTEYHAHVSPAFEQSLSLEAQIFGLVPLLRKVPTLDEAVFRLGLTYLVVAEVARPADTIVYNALPLFPEIEVNRSKWDMFSANFGITWRR